MFWFKKKEVVVDFFTSIQKVCDIYAPKKAHHFIPNWWKELPSTYEAAELNTNPTMKHCVGFRDLYANGIIIPMWCDIRFKVNEHAYFFRFANADSKSQEHNPKQYGFSFPSFHHIKLIPPWVINEKSGVNFVFLEPFWTLGNTNDVVRIPPAIVSFKINSEPNVNIFLQKNKEEYEFQIEAGTPMVHLIPLTERKLRIKTHVVDEVEFKKIASKNTRTKFLGQYYEHKRLLGDKNGD